MNLMIVEDEIRLLNNIAHNIPWEAHGIDVVAMVDNGLEALRMFEQTKPNVVLLDIQMPEMDGLTVAEKILEQDPLVKIVILSGHDDFKYAQAAIKLGVVKYVLKPSSNSEVLEAVLEARERLRSDLEVKYNQQIMQQKWAENLPRLQDLLYLNWISDKYAGWELEQRSRDLMLVIPVNTLFAAVVVKLDPLMEESRFTEQDSALLQFSLNGIAKEFLIGSNCHVFTDYDGATVLLFTDSLEVEDDIIRVNNFAALVHLHTTRLLSVFKEHLKVTASAGIGNTVNMKEAVAGSYRQACQALKERVVYGHDIVIPFRNERESYAVIPADNNLEKLLVHALETGNRNKALEVIEEFVERVIDHATISDEVHENVLFLSALIVRTIQSQGWPIKEVLGDYLVFYQNLHALITKDQIVQWLHGSIDSITRYVNEGKSTSYNALVQAMIDYVDTGITKDIGLHEVAGKLYINASYLSRLFKQHVGQSFTAYIVERKMKLAMQCLLDGMKVSDTASLIGYRDFSYFTRVFRKHWGQTPAEVKNAKGNPQIIND